MPDDRNDAAGAPRRRLGLPGQVRPGEQLETVFRDEVEWDEPDAPEEETALPGYPLDEARAATPPVPAEVVGAAPADAPRAVTSEAVTPEAVPPNAVAPNAVAVAAEPVLPVQAAPFEPAVPEAPAAILPAPAAGSAPAPVPEAPAPEIPLRAALEAVLMVVDEPITAARLAEVLERPRKQVTAALAELAEEYTAQQRGFELRHIAGGWRFYTRAVCAPVVDRFVLDGQQARLTQAALETLAVIAYRQPVSRSRVSAVRGVNCDGVMRTLVQRGLVEESGTEPETGAYLYRTTHYFLERMGLRGLDELPELAPFLPEAEDVEADSQEGSAIAEAVLAAEQ